MGFQVEGITGAKAEVDAQHNLQVKFPTEDANVGAMRLYTENDAGELTGVPFLMQPETSPDYKLRVGLDTLLFNDSFTTAAGNQNNNQWKVALATMTVTSGGGAILLNANSTLTSGTGVAVYSTRSFSLTQSSPIYVEFAGYPTDTPLTNQVVEFGQFMGQSYFYISIDFQHVL